MLTAWFMILQVSHLQRSSGNKSKEDRNLVVIGFLSHFLALNTLALKEGIIEYLKGVFTHLKELNSNKQEFC